MKIIYNSKKKNYICILAVGNSFLNKFLKHSLPLIKKYCLKHDVGLILFENHLISEKSDFWKKVTWQKLLIADKLIKSNIQVNNICMLDADILINPDSPNIFDFHKSKKISVVSVRKNLPYDFSRAVKNISFYRNYFYSKIYPLNSAIHVNLKQLYKSHNMHVQKDEFCAGVYVYNAKRYSKKFKEWYYKYPPNSFSITANGEQTHFNYEVFNLGEINYLDYKFQAIWPFEMAIYYPFLYKYKNKKNKLINECILTSLSNNYFLHFAGSWHESNMWTNLNINKDILENKFMTNLREYQKKNIRAKLYGAVKPR